MRKWSVAEKGYADARTDEELREDLANCVRILVAEGLFELIYGHMSCRKADGRGIWILRHVHEGGPHPAVVTADDIIEMDDEGVVHDEGVEAPGERFIHTAIYGQRPEVRAVVHCHPRVPVAFSVADVEIRPVDHLGVIFAPSVPIYDFSGQIDSPERAGEMAKVLGDRRAVLLRGHGVAVVGKNVIEACIATLALDQTARIQMMAASMGIARSVPEDNRSADGYFSMGISEAEYYAAAWRHFTWKHRELLVGGN